MQRRVMLVLIALVASAFMFATNAVAQYPVRQSSVIFNSPTVSPYVNLGYTAEGFSNYPMLVRPMLEERDAQLRQTQTLSPLERQVRGAARGTTPQTGRESDPRARGAANGRFMNLSHFFGGQ